jgi:DNA-binding GntR family transcriptional regulator
VGRPEQPAYIAVADALRERALKLPEKTALPSIAELMDEFKQTEGIVRRALGELRTEGLVSSSQGKGYFVRKPPRLLEPDDLEEIMRRFDDLTAQVRNLAERVDRLESGRRPRAAGSATPEPQSRRRPHRAAP